MEAKDTVISWERIRMVLHEQDKKGTTDNMFRLEAIAEAQRDFSDKGWIEELDKLFEDCIEPPVLNPPLLKIYNWWQALKGGKKW